MYGESKMRIYFLGIGGTAMGNLAILMREQGYGVCGSGISSPMMLAESF
jgi:UDP-N-acetylmuramate-alanine ligase